jgi:hypothetical protein
MRRKVAPEFLEKRFSKRVPLSLPISGKIAEAIFRGHKFEGKTEDVSYDGLGISVPVPNGFRRGKKIKFKTQLYRGDILIKAAGIVRWVDTQNGPEGRIRIGVELKWLSRPSYWYKRIEEEIV